MGSIAVGFEGSGTVARIAKTDSSEKFESRIRSDSTAFGCRGLAMPATCWYSYTIFGNSARILRIGRASMSGDGLRKLRFGPFELSRDQRELRRDGLVLPVGGRALDILIYLVARPGEVVKKKSSLITRGPM